MIKIIKDIHLFWDTGRLLHVVFSLCVSRNIKFNYCILDEGHVIKNGKTKLSKAIKQLAANFRIILSGTPIQVGIVVHVELWFLLYFFVV